MGRRPSAQCDCLLPTAAPALPVAELEHRLPRHEARCRQDTQLHKLCHGGHSRRNVWGKKRSFYSQWRTRERGVLLRLCLPAPRTRHLAPAVLGRKRRLWHGPSCDLPSRAGIGRAGDATCFPPSHACLWLHSPGASAWAAGAWEPGQHPRGFITSKVTRLISHGMEQRAPPQRGGGTPRAAAAPGIGHITMPGLCQVSGRPKEQLLSSTVCLPPPIGDTTTSPPGMSPRALGCGVARAAASSSQLHRWGSAPFPD